MRCFAISDLHLSFSTDKPMDKFGEHWTDHHERVAEHWRARIGPEDLVLLPGDHSWALKLEQADRDMEFISDLPGHKVLVRGNHDYWWQSLSRIRARFPALTFLQNDAVRIGDYALCGTRGWNLPGRNGFSDPQDEKIYQREVERLKLSTQALSPEARYRIALIHYPPLTPSQRDTGFSTVLAQAGVHACVYGHLHTHQGHRPFTGTHLGVRYYLVACDQLDFVPLELEFGG